MPKYEKYIVKLIKENEVEEIKFNGINQSDYKGMLNVYTDTKNKYKGVSCKIEFIGESKDGALNVMWEKVYTSNSKDKENNKIVVNDKNKTTKDIIKTIIDNLDLLINKNKQMAGLGGVIDKKQDRILHKIEKINNDMPEKHRLKLLDELTSVRVERREFKTNTKRMSEVFSQNSKNIKTLKANLSDLLVKYNKEDNVEYDFSEENLKQRQVTTERKYKNDKERIKIISQLKNRYDKVAYDENTKTIYAYDNGYEKLLG